MPYSYFAYAGALVAINIIWLFLTILGLPGNWLMILSAGVLAWYTWNDAPMFSAATLILVVFIALIGELLEFLLGAAGAKKAGSSFWGALGSIIGAVVGGILGTIAIPIPVVGSIIGACAGAFAGALGLEMLAGQPVHASLKIGKGAAIGRFWGTLAKLAVGIIIFLSLAVAAFVP